MFMRYSVLSLLIFAIVLGLSGCGSKTEKAQKPTEEQKIEAALSKLPPADQEKARKQKMCPVADSPLGSMGVPKKVTVKGHDVFLCCEGCEEDLKKEPEKYLKKLGLEK